MNNYGSRSSLALGKTPKHISEKQILDYFIYTFEFTWVSEAFDNYRDNLRVHFKTLIEGLKEKHELPVGKQWWALVFFALKDLAEAEKLKYAVETIQFVINRIHTLTDLELEHYANMVNDSLLDQMPDVLTIRPLEIINLGSQIIEKNILLSYFIENKNEFIKILSDNLEINDIEKKYIKNLLANDDVINEQFSSFWERYFELYVEFSLSMHSVFYETEFEIQQITDDVLQEINLIFLIASVKNSSKIDKLNEELSSLCKPLYLNLKECK